MKKQINPNIRAHLVRETSYVLTLVAICVIPFALAQRQAAMQSVAKLAGNSSLAPEAQLTLGSRVGSGTCTGYSFTLGTATFVPGVDDTGNHCDDCLTAIALPFSVTLYDQIFTMASVGSNGALFFGTANATFDVTCSPFGVAGTTYTMGPYWADECTGACGSTTCTGCGIFTTTTGTAPNRIFYIEYRTNYFSQSALLDYEVALYENGSPPFSYIYNTITSASGPNDSQLVVGVKKDDTTFTQYGCDSTGGQNPPVSSGQELDAQCMQASPTPTPTATATPTPTPTSTATPTPTRTVPALAVIADFNGDGHPDWVIRNVNTGLTALVYLNDNAVVGAALGPTLPANLALTGAADFNLDMHPDYALFAPNTFQTVIAYLSGPTVIGAALGPTLPAGWELIATADFNGDNHPDFVIFKRSTRQAAIVFLNNNVVVGAALLPTFPNGWNLAGVADFNSDGHIDIVLVNSDTGRTVIGYLSGGTLIGAALGPTLPMNWLLVGAADFNGDGHPDYLLYRPDTRQTAIWHLNNNVFIDAVSGVTLPSGWTLLSH